MSHEGPHPLIQLLAERRSFAASAAASVEVETRAGILSCIPVSPFAPKGAGIGASYCAEFSAGHSESTAGFLVMSEATEVLGDILISVCVSTQRPNLIAHVCWRGGEAEQSAVIDALCEWTQEHLTTPSDDSHSGTGPQPDKRPEGRTTRSDALSWVRTAGPSIGPRELLAVGDAVRNGWNEQHDTYLSLLCEELRSATGAEFVLPTSSCTGALHLALAALDLGPGDEVIVPDITWIATASAVHYTGATPIPIPVDDRTWCMNAADVLEHVGPRTRAVMPVDLYGNPSDLSAIRSELKSAGIRIIRDAAASLGASVHGRPVGSDEDFSCFSFQGAKTFVGGEGGALVTSNPALYERARKLNDHGRRPGTFVIDQVGMKYKMSNLTAALVYGQVADRERHIRQKRRVRAWYEQFFDGTTIEMQEPTPYTSPTFWMNSVRIRGLSEGGHDLLASFLRERMIDSRAVFPRISSFGLWSASPNLGSSRIHEESLNIPSGVRLQHRDVERVAEAILDFARTRRVSR